jgi:hypothetical protein
MCLTSEPYPREDQIRPNQTKPDQTISKPDQTRCKQKQMQIRRPVLCGEGGSERGAGQALGIRRPHADVVTERKTRRVPRNPGRTKEKRGGRVQLPLPYSVGERESSVRVQCVMRMMCDACRCTSRAIESPEQHRSDGQATRRIRHTGRPSWGAASRPSRTPATACSPCSRRSCRPAGRRSCGTPCRCAGPRCV